jgi:tetratricopeptide (TPR) repeat protein
VPAAPRVSRAQAPLEIEYWQYTFDTRVRAMNELIEQFQAAKVANPRFVQARVLLGVTLYSLGDSAAALAEWKEALTVDPDKIVRFVLLIRTPGGVNNVRFSGLRCNTREWKDYALARADHTWLLDKDPSWERVRARLEWLMADPTMVTDDLIKTRQAIFQQPGWLRACEANMALQNPDIRKRNMLTDDDLRSMKVPALVL